MAGQGESESFKVKVQLTVPFPKDVNFCPLHLAIILTIVSTRENGALTPHPPPVQPLTLTANL